MQKVINWNLQDAVPILTGGLLIGADIPVRVEFAAGVNRFSWAIRQGATSYSEEVPYGSVTG